MATIAVISSRLLCRASEYNLAASSRNLPNNAARAALSAASRWVRACACCVVHEVANEVRPPMALPASAAKAEMYAASIGLARCGISCRLYDELVAVKKGLNRAARGRAALASCGFPAHQ